MKNSIFSAVFAMVFLAGTAFPLLAQTTLPEDIQSAVGTLFPNATQVEWENTDDERTVYLMDDAYNVEITFDEESNWVEISTYLSAEDLPEAAQAYLAKEFADQELNNVLKIKNRKGTNYYVNFETETQVISLSFGEEGKLTERQVEDIDN